LDAIVTTVTSIRKQLLAIVYSSSKYSKTAVYANKPSQAFELSEVGEDLKVSGKIYL